MSLHLLSPYLSCRYLVWIRKNNRQISIVRDDFNQKEDEVRSHPEYEEIVESDIEAMSLFRKVGNLGSYTVVEDDTTVGNRSVFSRASSRASSVFRNRRHSLGGSVSSVPSKGSLPSVPEEKDGEGEEDDDDDEDTDSRKPAGKMKFGSPGNSSLGTSSHMFSPASKVDLSTQASPENPDSENSDSE